MNKPIKILVHGMTGNPGGKESCIMNYCRNIDPDKIHFDFLCVNEPPAYSQEITNRGGKIYCIPGRRKYFTHYRELVSIFKENKYDGFWSNATSLPGVLLFFKIARKFGVPLRILHAHSSGIMSPIRNNRIFHEIDKRRIEKYVTDFWSCSEKASKFFYSLKTIKSSEHRIINNAINLDNFRFDSVLRDDIRKTSGLENKLVIGHIGHFSPVKNHAFLIRVFNEIYKKEPNAVLLLVGDGALRQEIEDMVKTLNVDDAVHFWGVRSDISTLLNAMDIFVSPSKFEGLPFCLIEAQALSLPCFTSTNVSSQAKITNLLSFIDLKETPEKWADLVLAKRNYKRINMTENIRKAGYDIKTEAANIEQYLLDRLDVIYANKNNNTSTLKGGLL